MHVINLLRRDRWGKKLEPTTKVQFTFRACFLDTTWVSTADSSVSTSFALAIMVSMGSIFFFLAEMGALLGFRSDIEAKAWATIGDFCF